MATWAATAIPIPSGRGTILLPRSPSRGNSTSPGCHRQYGHARTYASAYDEGELGAWAGRVRDMQTQGRDAHVYFDSTAAGAALHNALRLKEMLS
ncbi:MAG: DUF72 domain-containing protein [Sulfuricella sp.]